MVLSDLQQAFLRPPGPCKRSAAGRYTLDAVPAVVPDGGINALSGLRALQQAFLRPPGPRKRSDAGRYTSDAVPAVVPDGGINALSGLRVLCWFKQRRPAQAQRRRAIHIRHRTRGCAGWRHKCLIRPTSPPQVKQRRPAQAQRRRAAGDRTEFDEESGCRKAKTRLLGGFFK